MMQASASILLLCASALAVPFSRTRMKDTALLLIDIQNDFINGSLGSPRAYNIFPTVYDLLDNHEFGLIVASQDWHPENHISFAKNTPDAEPLDNINISYVGDVRGDVLQQTVYADHCVPGTFGAELESGVKRRLEYLEGYDTSVNYIKKAQNHSIDSYSAFLDNMGFRYTTLNDEFKAHKIEKVIIAGLITSACVRGSAIDGHKLGYEVTVISDGVDTVSQELQDTTLAELSGFWGINVQPYKDWSKNVKWVKGSQHADIIHSKELHSTDL